MSSTNPSERVPRPVAHTAASTSTTWSCRAAASRAQVGSEARRSLSASVSSDAEKAWAKTRSGSTFEICYTATFANGSSAAGKG